MGTRADFYIGRGNDAEWLGSLCWDGYRVDEMKQEDAKGDDFVACWAIKSASNANDYRAAVEKLLSVNESATTPDQGWPWPWETSRTTDYSYAFDEGQTWTSIFGHPWHKAGEAREEEDESDIRVEFPNMKDRKNVNFGSRSGLIVIGG